MRSKQTKCVDIPVICIGNITAGGGGKTPTVIAINKLIKKHKIFKNPFFLLRGYKGKAGRKPRLIKVQSSAKQVGDEALLLASHSNTITSVNRYDGAKFAHELGADCILMDDGFQNPTLFKDISILVIDGKKGLGNERIIPAGPLREPAESALDKCSAVTIIGEDISDIKNIIPPNIPVFTAKIIALNVKEFDLSKSYIAFAGIANPDKFKSTLRDNKFKISKFYAFSDHHKFTENELKKLIELSREHKAHLITTEKDFVRIPKKYHKYISFISIELYFDKEAEIINFLKQKLPDSHN